MNKTIEDSHSSGWSICLAAEWPRVVDEIDVTTEKRVTLPPNEAIAVAQMCKRRKMMDGVYLNGACPLCPMKHRLDLECLN